MSPIYAISQLLSAIYLALLRPFEIFLVLLASMGATLNNVFISIVCLLSSIVDYIISWVEYPLHLALWTDDAYPRPKTDALGPMAHLLQTFKASIFTIFTPILDALNSIRRSYHSILNCGHTLAVGSVSQPHQYLYNQIHLLRQRIHSYFASHRLRLEAILRGYHIRVQNSAKSFLGITSLEARLSKLERSRKKDLVSTFNVFDTYVMAHSLGELRTEVKGLKAKIIEMEAASTKDVDYVHFQAPIAQRPPEVPKAVAVVPRNKRRVRSYNLSSLKAKLALPKRAATAPNTPDLSEPVPVDIKVEEKAKPVSRRAAFFGKVRDTFAKKK